MLSQELGRFLFLLLRRHVSPPPRPALHFRFRSVVGIPFGWVTGAIFTDSFEPEPCDCHGQHGQRQGDFQPSKQRCARESPIEVSILVFDDIRTEECLLSLLAL